MVAKTKPSWPSVTGPLAEYADGFRAELARLGYTPLTTASQLRLVAHLSRWLAAEGLGAPTLTVPVAERYFAGRRSAGYANERTVAALGPLLGYLRGLGAAPAAVAASPATATGQLLARYAGYLATERGLAQATVTLNVRLVRPFLLRRAQERDGRLDLEQLTAAEVRAVLLLLARMGLRAGEVAALGLDDIDWRRGEITVCGKRGRRDRLPLPVDVGQAIVAYLRDGRPEGALDRTVFIRAQAPRRALTYLGITEIVAIAARRAGIPGRVRAHRLRHSAATAMLRAGGSLTEIGQTLRHVRPLTTAIYAKVNVEALRPLARPWPGEPT